MFVKHVCVLSKMFGLSKNYIQSLQENIEKGKIILSVDVTSSKVFVLPFHHQHESVLPEQSLQL